MRSTQIIFSFYMWTSLGFGYYEGNFFQTDGIFIIVTG